MHAYTVASILTALFLTTQVAAQNDPLHIRGTCSRWPEFVDKTITVPPGPTVTVTTTATAPITAWITSKAFDVFLVETVFTSTTTKLGGTTTLYTFPDTTSAPRFVRVKREASADAAVLQERNIFDSITRNLCSRFITTTTSTYTPAAPTTSIIITAGPTITRTTWLPGSTTISTTSIVSTAVAPAATTTVAACGKLDIMDPKQDYGVYYSTVDDGSAGSALECCKRCYMSPKGCDMWLFGGSFCRNYSGGNFGKGRATDSANCPFGRVNADYGVGTSGGNYAGAGPCGDH